MNGQRTTNPPYITIQEAAGRLNCSVRHLERVIACNDRRKIGVVKIGRRLTRIDWSVFESAFLAGSLRS